MSELRDIRQNLPRTDATSIAPRVSQLEPSSNHATAQAALLIVAMVYPSTPILALSPRGQGSPLLPSFPGQLHALHVGDLISAFYQTRPM